MFYVQYNTFAHTVSMVQYFSPFSYLAMITKQSALLWAANKTIGGALNLAILAKSPNFGLLQYNIHAPNKGIDERREWVGVCVLWV